MRFNHVAHQHRVVHRSAHRDAQVLERMPAPFGVMHHLAGAAREPRPQNLQEVFKQGIAFPLMIERHINRPERRETKADSDGCVVHEPLAVGKDLNRRGKPAVPGPCQKLRERLQFGPAHGHAGLAFRGRLLERRRNILRHGAEKISLTGRLGCSPNRGLPCCSRFSSGAHFPMLEKFSQPGLIGLRLDKLLGASGNRSVTIDRHERPGKRQRRKPLAQIFSDLALHLAGMLGHAIQTAVLGNPLGRGLGAALVDSRHVVHLVAHERKVVDDALGIDPVLFKHAGSVEHLTGHRVDEGHMLINDLRQILVTRCNHRVHAPVCRAAGERGKHVVGLNPRHDQKRNAHEAHKLLDRLDLAAQLGRHRRPVGLVLGIKLMAERLSRRVEDAGDRIGLHKPGNVPQHRVESLDRPRWLPAAGRERRQGVKCAEKIVGTVNKEQFWHESDLSRERSASPEGTQPAGALEKACVPFVSVKTTCA